ncbi:hypothetical protein KI387_010039 [Taxus chinensis]|uniref:Vacuolar protein sorting-associated protein 62 n=1 Tax=Taxus chinensis TaxID=29808 RepID=A0AA38FKD7_TAXCH|nr:hypothetical protein KI387_010039 [Taxus chinensis]
MFGNSTSSSSVWFCWGKRNRESVLMRPRLPTSTQCPFRLPLPLPSWPPGSGFASGKICLGEIEVSQVSTLEKIWSCNEGGKDDQGASFYKPVEIPTGYFTLGHYGQPNSSPPQGWVLVAKESTDSGKLLCECEKEILALDAPSTSVLSDHKCEQTCCARGLRPALAKPLNYNLVWSSVTWPGRQDGYAYFWLPYPSDGYKAMGIVVTNTRNKPSVEEVRCVRSDLTDSCQSNGLIWSTDTSSPKFPFCVGNIRPNHRGIEGGGVSTGTFYCSNSWIPGNSIPVACLKNIDFNHSAMPNLGQIHALVSHYGPTVFFHPDEIYFPSSVSWFFENGALLCKRGVEIPEFIATNGSNLPPGGSNDGKYWLDLPADGRSNKVKRGNLESAEVYVHVKPAFGGTFTDIAMWVFCPFNGPATAKIGLLNLPLSRIGEHVCDWEHFTLRLSNFTGELWRIYFSQHSGGEWVNTSDLEYIAGNKAVVYSSKSGHASFPRAGNFLQGDKKLGIGIRNDAARSKFSLDTSKHYKIIAAKYLSMLGANDIPSEPHWLQYMREWGPTIKYNSQAEVDKILRLLPRKLRRKIEVIFNKLPNEVLGEEGPTGPKEKNNWEGDERG